MNVALPVHRPEGSEGSALCNLRWRSQVPERFWKRASRSEELETLETLESDMLAALDGQFGVEKEEL